MLISGSGPRLKPPLAYRASVAARNRVPLNVWIGKFASKRDRRMHWQQPGLPGCARPDSRGRLSLRDATFPYAILSAGTLNGGQSSGLPEMADFHDQRENQYDRANGHCHR